MERRTITVYIEGRSYQLIIIENAVLHETMYEVITNSNVIADFLTEETILQDDMAIPPEERLRTVEGEQIARIIWTEILGKMEQ